MTTRIGDRIVGNGVGEVRPTPDGTEDDCNALNEVDLRAVTDRLQRGPATDRLCPPCRETMCSMDLRLDEVFYVERCDRCMGVFYDAGELETLLDKSVSKVFEVDHQRLGTLIEEEAPERRTTVRYVNCPVCNQLMYRKNYGSRSAVVVDQCRDHGMWLDGGELGQLLKWAKAGGRLHDTLDVSQVRCDACGATVRSTPSHPVSA